MAGSSVGQKLVATTPPAKGVLPRVAPATSTPQGPAPPAGSRGSTPAVIAAVVAVVAVAAIVAGVLLVSASDPESTAEPEPASARSDDASSASDSSTDASSDPSSEAGSTEPTSTVRPVTPTAADPRHPLGLDGHWVAMLVAYNRETDAHSHLASFPPGSSVLHSNDYTSLNPDYYVIFYNGGFATGEQAAAWCRSEGYTSDAGCYGRFLSLEPGVDPEAPELKVSP